jgi:hypothetical protein
MVSARATDWNLIQALPRSKRTPDIQTAKAPLPWLKISGFHLLLPG